MEGDDSFDVLNMYLLTSKKNHIALILILLFSSIKSEPELSVDQMQDMAEKIGKKFKKIFDDVTGYNHFQNYFEKSYTNGHFVTKQLNVSQVSETFSKNLGSSLIKNIDSVRRIRDTAIELEKTHTFNEELDYKYLNDKDKNIVHNVPTFSAAVNVNVTNSFVQVPTNIFRSSKEILNGAYWTKDLDKTFVDNYSKTPSLMWQSFGCETGMIRTYPGFK